MPQTSVSTAPSVAFAGMLADAANTEDVDSYVSEEASAEMPFGAMVCQGASDDTCKIFGANTDKMVGIVQHSHAYQIANELGAVGLKPKVTIGVKKRGKIWVTVDEAVTPASAVRVRNDANGGANTNGTFRTTASAGHTMNISSFARFLSTTTGAGVALLEYDVTMRSGATAD